MCASSLKKSYSLVLIWDANDAGLLLCCLCLGLWGQPAGTAGGQGEQLSCKKGSKRGGRGQGHGQGLALQQ